LNTPSIGAYKWWPGDLAHTSNWAFVYAQAIVDGKSKGVFPFFVQIRSMETHEKLPNVEIGDIGPKWGYSTKDNGLWLLRITEFLETRSSGNTSI